MSWPRTLKIPQMNKTYQKIDNMKAIDMNLGSTTIVEDLEVEDDSLEIVTVDHDGGFNASHAINKDTGMRIVHTKIELT